MAGKTFGAFTGRASCALLGFAALAACTSSPYIPEQKFAEASEARLVVVTGSRIPQMIDMNERNVRSSTPTSVITMDDIERTGELTLCRALRRMMPNMIGKMPGQPATLADIQNNLRC
ncbi:MAG: hypothetical protein HKN59_02860 [Gammaproteobacteria bacterium]|nr:hypothetical protein [Gammaproteobacteria bacterium]